MSQNTINNLINREMSFIQSPKQFYVVVRRRCEWSETSDLVIRITCNNIKTAHNVLKEQVTKYGSLYMVTIEPAQYKGYKERII